MLQLVLMEHELQREYSVNEPASKGSSGKATRFLLKLCFVFYDFVCVCLCVCVCGTGA
jgi:hypothetical protein